ncbi:hypothetical protein [uncultured Microbacterium sp.]|uniref:hypothetical protein n=1 Tax=uncultured Microbacterium sp. TaxID=191216 RepID=UPI002602C6B1|nr:hypothetical protein [uncultured Microbacterium sp.]
MSDSTAGKGPRRGWLIIAVIAVVLVAGGITWAVLAGGARTPADAGASAIPTASGTPVPTTPAVFPTPTAGGTAPVDKSAKPIEVSPTATAQPMPGAFVTLASIQAVTAGRDIPGEKSGPAVEVAVQLVNDSDKAIDSGNSGVTLTYGGDDRTPAVVLTDARAVNWPARILPGKKATAVYFFAVPLAVTGDVRVTVDLLPSGPDVVFVGPRP